VRASSRLRLSTLPLEPEHAASHMQDAMAALPAEVLIQVLARTVRHRRPLVIASLQCGTQNVSDVLALKEQECWTAYEVIYTKLELLLAWVAPVRACLGSPCGSLSSP
jgi:hypothetical protein